MMSTDAQRQLQHLLPLFHRSPVAMAETSSQGVIRQVNPKAIQLMMPLALPLGLAGDNLLDTLGGYLPWLRQTIAAYTLDSGVILGQEPYIIRFVVGQSVIERHFSLTIEKMDPDKLFFFFEDVTDFLIKADALLHGS